MSAGNLAGTIPYDANYCRVAAYSDGTNAVGITPTNALPVTPSSSASANPMKVTAGGPAPGQTIKSYLFNQALSNAGTTTLALGTVTTGKTYYVTDLQLSHNGNSPIDTRLQAAGVDIWRNYVGTSGWSAPGIESQPVGTTAQALQMVWASAGGPPTASGLVIGFEQ